MILRGFDGWYTSSYRDGLAQNVGITFLGVQTEVYGLERLEVLRGPSSVLFGKGDVGGVVNRVSKTPSADAVREVALQLGSYGRQQLAVDVGGALDGNGKLLYRLVGVGLDNGTQEQYPNGVRMDQKRQYLAPSLRWQPSAQTSLTVLAEYLRDDASDDVQFVTAADGLPSRIKEGDPSYSRIKTGSDSIGYQFEHRLDAGWRLQQKLRYARRTSDKHHILSFFDTSPSILERQARHDVESVRETAVDTSVQGLVHTGSVAHGLLFGLDWDRSRATWRRAQNMTTPLDMDNPVYGIAIAEPTTQVADTQLTSTQWGLYAQDQIRLSPHWGLTLGARHDRVRSDNADRLNAAQTLQTDSATTARIGVNYLVGNGWAPYASYAESFVPNVGVDAAGKAFQPSQGRQLELGVKYLPEGAPVSFAAAVFNLEKTDVVTYDPTSYEARQIGKLRSRGLELEAKASLSPQLRLTAAFTALDLKVLSSADPAEVGKTPILTPERTASVWLDYAVAGEGWRGLSFGAGLRHVGKRWNDAANTGSEPAYTLADAAVRFDTGPWRLALNVSNLFDKQYYSGHAYGSYFRGAERSVLLTAKYRF
ncbi:iron complex outermembrane recepter protein [Rhodoferax sp. OV413]|uniref:TonB-dependent siderophore receptor n=1 Tax=Rhodoferax sp. OV413 TaxID=1855285 RepID=UPI0008829654|nr:TonB-dependent siderophore receptor [Rhodoferax sp. OV413]SDO10291.1 iron complex outermembrane recepter protein [Rhodoferax sp. OV413]